MMIQIFAKRTNRSVHRRALQQRHRYLNGWFLCSIFRYEKKLLKMNFVLNQEWQPYKNLVFFLKLEKIKFSLRRQPEKFQSTWGPIIKYFNKLKTLSLDS